MVSFFLLSLRKPKSRNRRLEKRTCGKALSRFSYAGIIRIRFHGFSARLRRLSRETPAPIFLVAAIIDRGAAIVKS